MKHIEVPLAGGTVYIDTRNHTVDLVLAVEDGSRTVHFYLVGDSADRTVAGIVAALTSVTQGVLDELSNWVE